MAAPTMSACRRYLLLFAHEHLEFRLQEVKAISSIFDIKYTIPEGGFSDEKPYLLMDVESEDCVRKIMSRTMLVRSLYELWGQGANFQELQEDIKNMSEKMKAPYLAEDVSICVRVDTFNKAMPMQEKIKKIDKILDMETFPFKGTINLKSPDQIFQILEYYEHQSISTEDEPKQIYFGRWITDGQREHINKYNLQDRNYIGNTSMDPALSLIMANMGCVRENDFVYDPFVGTGSITVACAHFGAYVAGTDIDYNLLMGRGKASKKGKKWRNRDTDNLRANLAQYGLESRYLDVLVADASLQKMWNANAKFDAIITDPPYGVREATEKVGTKKAEPVEIPDHLKDGHIPCRIQYNIAEVFRDLMAFAARHLHLHGRIVYWLPVYRPEYTDEQVPRHPCLKLVSNCEQGLTKRLGRRLITMEKIKEWKDGDRPVGDQSHYEESSFRDMYFRPTDYEKRKTKEKVKQSKLSNLGEGHGTSCETSDSTDLHGTLKDLSIGDSSDKHLPQKCAPHTDQSLSR